MDIVEQGLARAREELAHLPGGIERATGRALKRAVTKARTESVRIVRTQYTIKAATARNDMKIQRYSGVLDVKGYTHKLTEFRVNPRRPTPKRRAPIKVQVRRTGGKTISRAFVAGAFNDSYASGGIGVYMRRTSKRRPLDELYGPSVPGMLSNPEHRLQIETVMGEEFVNRLSHEAGNILGGVNY